MEYYVQHLKALTKRPDALIPLCYVEGSITEMDIPENYFINYMQLVDIPHYVCNLIVVKTIQEYDFLTNSKYSYTKAKDVLLHNPHPLVQEQVIKNYEEENNLLHFLKSHWENGDKYGIKYFYFTQIKGFYYEEVCLQRIVMNPEIYNRFFEYSPDTFTAKDDFDFAFAHLNFYEQEGTNGFIDTGKDTFKQNFIDKYEEGSSFMRAISINTGN